MTKASIVAITQPRIEGLHDAEDLLAYMARVSNPANQMNTETAPKLIKSLLKKHHWSPLEMVNLVVEIETTRDIARQILRHRSFSFQEFSQRYADPTKALGFETREPRFQDTKNRQASTDFDPYDPEHEFIRAEWYKRITEAVDRATDDYNWAIEVGVAKEQARVFLPEGLTTSRLYMNGNLRSWVHYCDLRMANGTQKEHSEVAAAVWSIIEDEFPNTAAAIAEIKAEEVSRVAEKPAQSSLIYSKPKKKKPWWQFWRRD